MGRGEHVCVCVGGGGGGAVMVPSYAPIDPGKPST